MMMMMMMIIIIIIIIIIMKGTRHVCEALFAKMECIWAKLEICNLKSVMVFECRTEWECLRALSTPSRCHRPLVVVFRVSLNTLFFPPATVHPPLGKSAINPALWSRAFSVSNTSKNARHKVASLIITKGVTGTITWVNTDRPRNFVNKN